MTRKTIESFDRFLTKLGYEGANIEENFIQSIPREYTLNNGTV